jgi:RNA polymerase sigma-70 factor (ECF subfamily)
LNEWTLIDQLRKGDESAFKYIVDTWKDMVYNTALSIVQQAEDAEDVTQEVFVQVYQSIEGFKRESKFSTWLYRITLSKAMDNKEKAGILFKAMQSLPDNQRIAFVLNKVEGLSYQEISDVMDTTVSAVESLLHRAKSNLRKDLKTFYDQLRK